MARDDDTLTVYWQPGCSSCLKAREFLRAQGLVHESVNVLEQPEAFARLATLGVRSVPVVTRGARFVLAQDLAELARFVGAPPPAAALEQAVLAARLLALLDAGSSIAERLPAATLRTPIPGRERTRLDLAHHLGCIVLALLDAVQGGLLSYAHFERRPPEDLRSGTEAAAVLRSVAKSWAQWWATNATRLPATVDTYYGRQPLHGVLERSTWHVAQHLRQLAALLEQDGGGPAGIAPGLFDGLPLPAAVWEPEPTGR